MKIAVMGTDGHMGGLLVSIIEEREGVEAVGLDDEFDVIIDFSHPNNLSMIAEKAEKAGKPIVIATTGYIKEQEDFIQKLGQKIPVVYAANFSLGITIMKRLLAEVTPLLEDSFDMEIVEKHHNRKVDAPSGTAKMLLKAMNPDEEYEEVDGRSGMRKRGKEIGVHAIRGGTIAGEHTAIYAGDDEILEIKHTAGSRKIFANGSIKAAEFAVKAKAGLYDMDDVLFGNK